MPKTKISAKAQAALPILLNQVLNSVIVSGLAIVGMLSANTVSAKAIAVTFFTTFLVELRKYRGL